MIIKNRFLAKFKKTDLIVMLPVIAAGIIMVIHSINLFLITNFSFGELFLLILGVLFLGFGGLYVFLPKWLRVTFYICVILLIGLLSFLYIYGNTDTASYNEDALIVLGSGIRGETISVSLQYRLDAAIEYHQKNKDAVIVLCGGQGPNELITESLAMERYLLANGVPEELIIREEASTSTRENFEFSKKLLDSRFKDGYSVCFITSNYHIYRAERTAHAAGFRTATHCHGKIPLFTAFPNALREIAAIVAG